MANSAAVLGVSGMHADTLDCDFCRGGVEVLKLKVAEVAAVHGVCPLAAELLNIEVVRAHADFLVGIEAHAYVAVLHLVVVSQPAHGLHNLGYASLVVSPEQGVAVGHDDVFALVSQKLGEFLCR